MAADSRQVISSPSGQLRADSDNANKIHQLSSHLAVLTLGQGNFYSNKMESPQSVGEFFCLTSTSLPKNSTAKNSAVYFHQKITRRLNKHRLATKDEKAGLVFYIAGYGKNENIGELYRCQVPGNVTLERRTNDAGVVWEGESIFINRLILGYDPRLFDQCLLLGTDSGQIQELHQTGKGLQLFINFQTMPLQDAVDLAVFLVQLTINCQKFSNGTVSFPGQFPTCGGKIDVAVITKSQGFQWLQRKQLAI
ncbi:MAG: hypothetical protein C0410_08750 [Anaerolinea sp.]|nr:hypothetical protein [Anaerolinea sp.]